MDLGSASNRGPSSVPSLFPDLTPFLGAQIALPDALTIGQSLAMLEHHASSPDGGICSCKTGKSRPEAGRLGVWKDTNWVPVIFMPYLPSLRRRPGRAWMFSGWSTGFLRCVICGGLVAVVSAELSGCVVTHTLHATLANIAPNMTKPVP